MGLIVASGGTSAGGFLFVVFLVAAVVGLVLLLRGEKLRFETTCTPQQVAMAAVGEVGTKRRWTTLTQGHGTVTFSYYKRPSCLLVLLLVVFIVSIPLAILYFILGTKRESLSVYADDSNPGATQVQITSNGHRGKSAGRAIRAQLAVGIGTGFVLQQGSDTPAVSAPPQAPTLAAGAAPTLPQAAGLVESVAATARRCTCGEPLPEGTKFCASCGQAAAQVCSGCGERLAPSTKFCGECGMEVPGANA